MSDFETKLLNKLLDKYENSKLSKGGTQVNRRINLTTKDEVLSSYNGYDSYKYADKNNASIEKLEELGFVQAEFKGDVFKSLTLNVDSVDAIYKYLRRVSPAEENAKVIGVLSKYHFANFIAAFASDIQRSIEEKYTYPKSFFNDAEQLDLILKTLQNLFLLDKETKIRDFSTRYLGDSKLFESIEGKIVKVLRKYASLEELTDEEVLESFNLVKNTSYVLLKNKLRFRLNKSFIDLDELGFEFSLSDEMIEKIEIEPGNLEKVITVENLTSFYKLEDKDALIIYLAGFHNHTKQKLLLKIFEVFPKAEYLHFGDIDAGGFWILANLRSKTGMPIKPYKMGIEELKGNFGNLKKLTQNDRERLTKMLNEEAFSEFKETIRFMLDNDVKLEQEILD